MDTSQKLDVHYGSLIPEEWEFRSVLSLGSFIQGTGFPEELQGLREEQYPFFKVSDFTLARNRKYLKDFSNSISRTTLKKLGAKVIPAQSLVFAKVGAALLLNRRRITTKESVVDNNCAAIVPSQNIDLEFLYQTLLNIDFENYVQDGAVPSINQHILDGILVPIPKSLSEQKKIASILQSVDNAIEKTKELIEKYRKMKQGLMQDIINESLEGRTVDLGDKRFVKLITKGTTPTTYGYQFVEKGVNFIKVESISEEGYFIKDQFQHIDEATHEFLKRSQLVEGDVLFSIAGAIGRCAIVPRDILPANTNQALAILRFKDKTNVKFLKYMLQSDLIQQQLNKMNVQLAQANLSLENVAKLRIICPDSAEQEKTVKVLDGISNKIEAERSYLDKLVKIKSGLMQDLLTGRVSVAA